MRDRKLRGVVAVVRTQARRPALELRQRAGELLPARLRQLHLGAGAVANVEVAEALAHEQILELGVLLEVELLVAELHLVERRHGDVDVAVLEELAHVPVEEREDERADVRAVDVGVGHDDDPVVTQAGDVELVADAGADRGDHRLDLRVREHLVDPVLLAVDDLPAQRQDRLVRAVAAALRRAAGGIALDDEELGGGRVANRAVGELARQEGAVERRLAPRQLARLPRREPRAHRRNRLVADRARVLRVLLEEARQGRVDGRLDETLDARIAELRLRLPLELRVAQLDRDHGGEPFADVLAVEALLLLQELELSAPSRSGCGSARCGSRKDGCRPRPC